MGPQNAIADSFPPKPRQWVVDGWIAIAVQVAAVVVALFGDIGFDHPGRFGLDYDDLAKIALVYLAAALYGAVRWGIARNFPLCALQLLPIALGLVWFLMELV